MEVAHLDLQTEAGSVVEIETETGLMQQIEIGSKLETAGSEPQTETGSELQTETGSEYRDCEVLGCDVLAICTVGSVNLMR
jgi:hypothetical protein